MNVEFPKYKTSPAQTYYDLINYQNLTFPFTWLYPEGISELYNTPIIDLNKTSGNHGVGACSLATAYLLNTIRRMKESDFKYSKPFESNMVFQLLIHKPTNGSQSQAHYSAPQIHNAAEVLMPYFDDCEWTNADFVSKTRVVAGLGFYEHNQPKEVEILDTFKVPSTEVDFTKSVLDNVLIIGSSRGWDKEVSPERINILQNISSGEEGKIVRDRLEREINGDYNYYLELKGLK